MKTLHIEAIPAFADNYLWLIHNSQNAVVVDPGDAAPVQAYLDRHHLTLQAILLTHHHSDHIGGLTTLLERAAPGIPVFGPAADQQNGRIVQITQGCHHNDRIRIDTLGLDWQVLAVPGHTSSHIAWYSAQLGAVFCGDTLFAGGCGRLFEGTPQQMVNSLQRLTALPPDTLVYCAHEYTASNLRFAVHVEPGNTALQQRVAEVSAARSQQRATIPSRIDIELQTNPFLRTAAPEILQTLRAAQRLGPSDDPVSVFAALREWKNTF